MITSERRLFVSGIDSDTVIELIQNGFYRYALNVHLGTTDTGNSGAIENIKGNLIVSATAAITQAETVIGVPAGTFFQGTFKVVGSREDALNERVIYFVQNNSGGALNFDRILEYNYVNNTIAVIQISAFLFLSRDFLITGINIVNNNLLYWTDDNVTPKKINIDKAKLTFTQGVGAPGAYPQLDAEVIEAVKYPPLFPPAIAMGTNNAIKANNIIGKNFQFKYFYFKDDGEESCCSPISEINISQGTEFIDNTISYLPSLSTKNNYITVTINTGTPINVKIGILVRQGNVGDFFLLDVLDKAALNIPSFASYNYDFYNDRLVQPYELRKSIQLFDNLPLKAKAQEYIDGNRLVYGNILEGYENPSELDVQITPSYTDIATSATFSWTATFANPFGAVLLTLPNVASGVYTPNVNYVPEEGDIITISGLNNGGVVSEPQINHTVTAAEAADYYPNGATLLRTNLVAESITPTSPTGSLTMIDPFTGLPLLSFQLYALGFSVIYSVYRPVTKLGSFKSGAIHPFGLVYYDYANRSGTTVRNSSMDIYAEFLPESRPGTGDYIQRIGMNWSISHQPPIWATHYQWVYTGNSKTNNFVQFTISGITASADGTSSILNISPLVNYVLSNPTTSVIYSFTPGDRCRFITDSAHDAYSTYVDVQVLSFTSPNQLIVQLVSASGITIGAGTMIEIYSPTAQTEEKIFWEFSEAFAIINPGTANRQHAGQTQSQNFQAGIPATGFFDRGDVWIRPRRTDINPTTTVPPTPQWADDYVEDFNISDFYESKFWDRGRPNRVGEENQPLNGSSEYREIRRLSTIPYSDVFVPETNINGLSRFFDFNFETYDANFGSIQKLYSFDRRLEVYQEQKVGAIPIQQKVGVDASNSQVTYETTQILNQIVYFNGNFGIGLNPESFASFENRRYFTDVPRGFILRLSTDGITAISKIYKIHSRISALFSDIIQLGTAVHVYGVYNKRVGQYEVAVERTLGRAVVGQPPEIIEAQTFAFCEPLNCWTSWYSYHPEGMCGANQDFVSFKDGELWAHNTNPLYNNFYGVQYSCEIWAISNRDNNIQKVYQSFQEESADIFEGYEITNNKGQLSDLQVGDFSEVEGWFYAPFNKDANTPNIANPIFQGDVLRDSIMLIKLRNSNTGYVKIIAVDFNYKPSFRI